MRGVSAIIATVILLLIAVAMAGAAYSFLSGYAGSLTKGAVEVTSSFCTGNVAVTVLKNIGLDPIDLPTTLLQTEPYLPVPGETIALYHFDQVDGAGPFTTPDAGGAGHLGTLSANMMPSNPVTLDGTTFLNFFGAAPADTVSLPTAAGNKTLFEVTSAVTVEAWVYRTFATGSTGNIFSKFTIPTPRGYALAVTTAGQAEGDVAVTPGGLLQPIAPASQLLDFFRWYHLAITYDQATGTAALFVNGTQVATVTTSPGATINHGSPTPNPVIGSLLTLGGPTNYFGGGIDEVRVSNRAINFTSENLQGWYYICAGSSCGDLQVEKTNDVPTIVYFDKAVVNPGEIVQMRNKCVGGSCAYTISTGSSTTKTQVVCY